jgi:hypothetical protein
MKKFIAVHIGVLVWLAAPVALFAAAAAAYSLFGNATLVSPGNNSPTGVQFSSSTSPNFGGVDFTVPAGFTVADLNNLSTDYKFTSGSCGLGSPRFGATTSAGGTIFFYIGPPPNYTGCPSGVWSNTGNLAAPTNLVDATQLGGGFYEPYAAVQLAYGGLQITDLFIVADAGNPTQTVVIDNTMVNNTTYTYESADSCKDGGWRLFTSSPGPFRNQGQCVSYFEHQSH